DVCDIHALIMDARAFVSKIAAAQSSIMDMALKSSSNVDLAAPLSVESRNSNRDTALIRESVVRLLIYARLRLPRHRRDRHQRIVLDVEAFIAPAHIKETQLPHRTRSRWSNSKRFFESDLQAARKGYFSRCPINISLGDLYAGKFTTG